jgi:hypothetical protein
MFLLNVQVNYFNNNKNIVAYLLKARTVEPVKQLLLGNTYVTCNNGITITSDVFNSFQAAMLYAG